MQLKKFLYKWYCFGKSVRYYISYQKDNCFVKALYSFCAKREKGWEAFYTICRLYEEKLKEIDNYLFQYLLIEDKEVFLRFIIKRHSGQETATEEELQLITEAFEKTQKLYHRREKITDPILINFKDRKIKFISSTPVDEVAKTKEQILMNYYEVTHSFFLTEYEMEGFNPINGQTILDCGAANGDTLLLFKALYPDSQVHSFEYDMDRFNMLSRNVEINKIDNYRIVNSFLYKDSLSHILDMENFIIVDENEESEKKIIKKITTMSIDDYVREENLQDIGLIKFDIEGGELSALQGAINTIIKQKPLLYVPIYHLPSDIYKIPEFLSELNMPMKFAIKWTEKKVWGMDCVLFVRFER